MGGKHPSAEITTFSKRPQTIKTVFSIPQTNIGQVSVSIDMMPQQVTTKPELDLESDVVTTSPTCCAPMIWIVAGGIVVFLLCLSTGIALVSQRHTAFRRCTKSCRYLTSTVKSSDSSSMTNGK